VLNSSEWAHVRGELPATSLAPIKAQNEESDHTNYEEYSEDGHASGGPMKFEYMEATALVHFDGGLLGERHVVDVFLSPIRKVE